jgi:hypothetical protein
LRFEVFIIFICSILDIIRLFVNKKKTEQISFVDSRKR